MSGYEHDIFLSYRRSDEDWVRWTRDNFARALQSLLRPRLGNVRIFIDENIETGTSWPHYLAKSLSRSKLLVPVLSRDYFQSEWCQLELALILHREKTLNFRTALNPSGLIIPVVIDDGNCFPPEVKAIQSESLHNYANPFIRTDSPKQEALAELLRVKLCPVIESSLEKVPDFDPAWGTIAQEHFNNTFMVCNQMQTTVPSLSLPVIP